MLDIVIASSDPVVPGSDILPNHDDKEFDEEVVASFVAEANAERRERGLPRLAIGCLCGPGVDAFQELDSLVSAVTCRLCGGECRRGEPVAFCPAGRAA
jgi:hypothetical protein